MKLKQLNPAKVPQTRFCIGLIFLIALASCNRGSDGGIGSRAGGWPPPPASSPGEVSSSAEVVKATASPVQVAPGNSADASIKLSIVSGYHVNANPATYEYLIPTEVSPGKADGIAAGKPNYPPAHKQQFQFAEEPLAVYEGEIQITLPLRAEPQTQPGSRMLPVAVRIQACDHEKCFPPANLDSKIPVEVK